ncbi:symplekin [Tieghemostelium lacteum]|uniref:Symplekin n=1 Tax=Tieghemostelium lacteum TaxID=361077 RepID=A0A151Z4Y4_TIELA|nr:symplekin [Tieghemostelium lacteum]|eukprot:KYQ88998.1 symplekin [Tieghemostelium lacteum]
MATTKDQIIDVLNAAQLSHDEKTTDLLGSAFELLFHRDVSLLDEFFENLLEFAYGKSAVIKKQIISYIEQICKKYPIQFIKSYKYLVNLLNDQNKTIVKRTVLCISNLMKTLFSYVINFNNNEVWNLFNDLKNKIVQIHSTSADDEQLKTNTFKFLEILVLSFTSPGDYTSKKLKSDEEFCLDKVPLDHTIINREQIQQNGDNYLHLLLDSAKDLSNMISTNIMILVTSLTSIARQRYSLIPTILPVICSCPNILPKFQNIQSESVKHSLKTCLISIIRLKHSAITPYLKQLIEAAALVDAKDHAEESARWYRGEPEKKKRQIQEGSEQVQKKLKVDQNDNNNNNNNNYVNLNGGKHQELPGLFLDRFTLNTIANLLPTLPNELITEMVIQGMSHVPLMQTLQNIPYNPQTEKLYQFVNSYQNINQPQLTFNSNSGVYQPQAQPFPYNPNTPYQQPMWTGTSNSPTLQAQSPLFVPPPVIGKPVAQQPQQQPSQAAQASTFKDPRFKSDSQPDSKMEDDDDEEFDIKNDAMDDEENGIDINVVDEKPLEKPIGIPHANISRSSINRQQVEEEESAVSNVREEKPMFDEFNKPVFRIAPFSKEQANKVCLSAIRRLKQSESGANTCGKSSLWTSLLSRVLSMLPESEEKVELEKDFISFIVENFQSRREFALQWLQNEFFIVNQMDSGNGHGHGNGSSGDRYSNLLFGLYEKIRTLIQPSSADAELMCSFVLEIPMITDQLLDSILLNCVFIEGISSVDANDSKHLQSVNLGSDEDDSMLIELIKNSSVKEQWSVLSLKILRDLVLWRPTVRSKCLSNLLEFATSPNEKLRDPTIRLIANQLFSKSTITSTIQVFAKNQILSLIAIENIKEYIDQENLKLQEKVKKEIQQSNREDENPVEAVEEKEKEKENVETDQQMSEEKEEMTQEQKEELEKQELKKIQEEKEQKEKAEALVVQRYIERKLLLFFSLCAKNHRLILDLLEIYPKCKEYLQKIIQRMVGSVAKTIGQSSSEFLQVLSVCPEGAQSLMIEILKSLVENEKPSLELVNTVKTLIQTQDDPRFLLPIVHGLEKQEIIQKLPIFISQPAEDAKNFIRMLASPGSPISPSELLVQLHLLESTKRSMEAIDYCFENTAVFKQEFMAVTIQQLLFQTPLPKLLMRTVLKTLQTYPSLKQFIVNEILNQLITKQVWNDENLWSGFIICAKQASPESLHVIMQLPTPQFKLAIQKDAGKSSGNDLKHFLNKFLKAKTTNPSNYPANNIKALSELTNTTKKKSVSASSTTETQ